MLGISRATLYRKLKRYNIRWNAPEASSHALQYQRPIDHSL